MTEFLKRGTPGLSSIKDLPVLQVCCANPDWFNLSSEQCTLFARMRLLRAATRAFALRGDCQILGLQVLGTRRRDSTVLDSHQYPSHRRGHLRLGGCSDGLWLLPAVAPEDGQEARAQLAAACLMYSLLCASIPLLLLLTVCSVVLPPAGSVIPRSLSHIALKNTTRNHPGHRGF